MPRLSPLDSEHRALGARMVEFGGWTMPIQYTGVLEEQSRVGVVRYRFTWGACA